MRVAYLGPAGTYTHEALLTSSASPFGDPSGEVQELALATIHDVVMAVQDGAAQRGVVPIENSVEGSVNATLDALAFDASDVEIVGDVVLAIHHCLIARDGLAPEDVELVVSHPQALAQCAGFVRERLTAATVRTESSTAEAVRTVIDHDGPWAALGPRAAADRYRGRVIAADVEDIVGNQTRFAWLARAGDRAAARATPGGAAGCERVPFKTAVAFWPRESDHAGWLVDTLAEFARRGVNLTRIESRPRKVGLGEYVFFVDCGGAVDDPDISAALSAVRGHVAQLRVLGSFPAA